MAKSSLYVKESLAIAERVLNDAFFELQKREADADVCSADEADALRVLLKKIERMAWLVGVSVDAMDVRNSVKEVK
jgi:hypothetical protein